MKKIIALFCLALIGICCLGCSHTQKEEGSDFFPAEKNFHVGIQTEDTKTRVGFFFDKSGACHLLNEDPTSPLFGLEEVFTQESVTSYFHGMQFSTLPYCGGVGDVYQALLTVKEQEPTKISKVEGTLQYTYETEFCTIVFTCSQKNSEPISISGKMNRNAISIIFTAPA